MKRPPEFALLILSYKVGKELTKMSSREGSVASHVSMAW